MPETSPLSPLVGPEPVTDTAGAADATGGAERSDGQLYGQVAQVVKVIRPAIQADQGDIFLREVDESTGVVSVELVGACVDCPASSQTLKQGLERILKQRVDGVTEVRHVGEDLAGFDEGTKVSL